MSTNLLTIGPGDLLRDWAKKQLPSLWLAIEALPILTRSQQAAQGEVVYNDDTGMRVLGLDTPDPPGRKGVFTSGTISTRQGQRVALFFTGRRHAGENLAAVLARRAAERVPPIQMCDALSRNLPKSLK